MIFSQKSFTQETLSGLEVNPSVKKLHELKSNNKSSLKSKAVLELPFIDDFAKTVGLPDSSLWIDDMAFINQSYADSVPSIGVATLDAISSNGTIYGNASSLTFSADTLTSKQINLNYPGNNTIYISFYYQPGGLGDSPEFNDTLLLEYYSVDSLRWQTAWKANFNKQDSILIETNLLSSSVDTIFGKNSTILQHQFQQVILPVNQDQFLKSEFQFRFRNYASLSSSEGNESRASNSDHWHLDFIILDKDRNENDTIVDDASIIEAQKSLLKNFEALPWDHWQYARSTEMDDSLRMLNRNLSNVKKNQARAFRIKILTGLSGEEIYDGGNIEAIPPFSTQYFSLFFNDAFPIYPEVDSILFQISGYISSDVTPENEPYRWNDTTHFYQKFYNYYAYDDGTSENGYGLIGEGTERGMVAMRFKTYQEDTLSGIQIYFNQTLNNANQYTYKIHVWDEEDGKPGSILYTLENQKPTNSDDLNKFILIPFDEKLVLSNTFYIGWQKEYSREMLNVGFDINRINNDKLFYNFNGEWKQSEYEGTVMIRPMFGKKVEVITNTDNKPLPNKLDFTIYPNPANDILNINYNFTSNYTYFILDAFGRLLKSNVTSETGINISDLNAGIYFIRISDNNNTSTTQKFIIIR